MLDGPNTTDERPHSDWGGSRAKTFLACTASPMQCKKTPRLPSTKEQTEGTAAHKLIQLCINFGHNPDDFVNRFIGRVEVTPEMAEAVTPMVERARTYIKAGAKIFVEHAFALADFDAELWGTCDLIAYFPDTKLLKVEDFKYGAGKWVDHVNNDQLKMYGLGAMLTCGFPVEKVELTIDQPRSFQTDETCRTWSCDPMTLLEFGADLAAAVDIGRGPNATFKVGKHCDFCQARGSCPAVYDAALKAAGADVEPNTGSFLTPIAPELMTLEELGRRLDQADILRSWLNGLHAFANAEMMRGRIACGRKAVMKEGRRKIINPELFASQAPRIYPDITEEQMFKPATVISPSAFERLVGKANAQSFLKVHVERPKKLKLVSISASGDPVAVGALADFADITADEGEDGE